MCLCTCQDKKTRNKIESTAVKHQSVSNDIDVAIIEYVAHSKTFNGHYNDEVVDNTDYEVMAIDSVNIATSDGDLDHNDPVRNDVDHVTGTTVEIPTPPTHEIRIKTGLLTDAVTNEV